MDSNIHIRRFSYLNHTDIMSIARVCTPFRTLAFDGYGQIFDSTTSWCANDIYEL